MPECSDPGAYPKPGRMVSMVQDNPGSDCRDYPNPERIRLYNHKLFTFTLYPTPQTPSSMACNKLCDHSGGAAAPFILARNQLHHR